MSRFILSTIVALSIILVLLPVPASSQDRGTAERLGKVNFPVSCSAAAQQQFERAVAQLHSFWFKAAIQAFAGVAQSDPSCAMAHWGTAMTLLGNPLAAPPAPKTLAEGWAAVERATTIGARTPREADYIAAIGAFYKDADRTDHRTRALAYEKAMERLAATYPADGEATIFYALSLNMTLVPTDKTYSNQLKAAALLGKVFAEQPDHPGVAHYLIHSYDFPPIAGRGLPAARRYASIAPAAPHAQHMPSHIFTRVGAWQESIDSNRAAAALSRADGERDGALHAMDYMMYAYLQTAQDREAKRLLDEVAGVTGVSMTPIAGFFGGATIPARYALERRAWGLAASLEPQPSPRFPFTEAITHFARALGAARSGNAAAAQKDVDRLEALRDALTQAKVGYWAEQVEIQRLAAAAWVALAQGRRDEALKLMRSAADLEDSTEKHPVTPGSLAPARELLGEMLLELKDAPGALREFEASMKKEPNRFNGTYGAARAAELAGDRSKAREHYTTLLTIAAKADTERPEIRQAKAYLGR
jgi:tetratricopeptide (TPR) repeat protein